MPHRICRAVVLATIAAALLAALPAAAAPASQAQTAPAALPAAALAALFQTPPATPATTYTLGVCESSCSHPTCPTGPHGFCIHQTCYIGYPFNTCPNGTDRCLLTCDL